MVSGGYKGASININDWIVVGLIGVAAYFLYKSIVKPTSQLTSGIGEAGGTVFSETGQSYKAVSDFFQQGWNYLTSQIGAKEQTKNMPAEKTSIYQAYTTTKGGSSNYDYVTRVTPAGTAFGKVPLQTVTLASGKSTTIAAAPNTYYKDLGIGFSSKGQGYSSYTALKR